MLEALLHSPPGNTIHSSAFVPRPLQLHQNPFSCPYELEMLPETELKKIVDYVLQTWSQIRNEKKNKIAMMQKLPTYNISLAVMYCTWRMIKSYQDVLQLYLS